MGRALKKHQQQSFRVYAKPLDKNNQLRGAVKGEKRRGVGRPKRGDRASERHQKRASFAGRNPIHVVVRAHEDVQPLRRKVVYQAIRRATKVVARSTDMRIVYYSIQNTHIHLLVEAADKVALAKGMQSFGVSAARHINTALFEAALERGLVVARRQGPVIADRYHARILKTPREVRNCISYVMNNWRHHGADRDAKWPTDWYSSGPIFRGWSELGGGNVLNLPARYEPLFVREPTTWLLSIGWQSSGTISWTEVPGNDGH